MVFALSIDFPLGYYQGRDPRGEPERYPTVNRIYSALIAAAFEAEIPGPSLGTLLEALSWLEGDPPDAISLPSALMSSRQSATAYRDKGLSSRNAKTGQITATRPQSEHASRVSSVDGPLTFWWKDTPSEEVVTVLSLLAEEIAYIGERSSLARVEARVHPEIDKDALPVSKNHLLPDRQAVRMEYPEVGRLKELSDAYAKSRPRRLPSDSQDQPKSKEEEQRPLPPRLCVGLARYRRPVPQRGTAPWTHGFLVEAMKPPSPNPRHSPPPQIEESSYVGWSVALHRSIIRHIGWGASPLITGIYAQGVDQPANHMAIQVLPPTVRPAGWRSSNTSAFVVLFPPEASPEDYAAVRKALQATTSLYRGKNGKVFLGRPQEFDPTKFWKVPDPGFEYWWKPTPAAICEIRSGQEGPSGEPWSIANALELAVGFVWRDRFGTDGLKGLPLYQHIVRSVEATGVQVRHSHKKHFLRSSDFAHKRKVPDALTAVTGELWLQPLGITTELVAIGQSRHLGGGLLMPVSYSIGSHSLEEEQTQ